MLYLHDSTIVAPFLIQLMFLEDCFQRGVLLTGTVCIGYSDVEESILPGAPETPSTHVRSSIVFQVGSSTVSFSVCNRLEQRFCLDIMCYDFQEVAFEVPNVVVTGIDEATTVAIQCMVDSEGGITRTL